MFCKIFGELSFNCRQTAVDSYLIEKPTIPVFQFSQLVIFRNTLRLMVTEFEGQYGFFGGADGFGRTSDQRIKSRDSVRSLKLGVIE